MKIFLIENEDGEILEAGKANSTSLMGVFKPGEHWNFFAGQSEKNLPGRKFYTDSFSIEYGVEIPEKAGKYLA